MFFFLSFSKSLSDSDPLISQELVDKINNNPKSTFRAALNPKFAKMTIGDAKRFLSPIRAVPSNRASAVPIGANENFMHCVDKQYVTGLTNLEMPSKETQGHDNIIRNKHAGPGQVEIHTSSDGSENYYENIQFPVYDVTQLCSSWAPAVTSAMSISVSRWAGKFINFSLQYVLDCDILGDACIERTPLNAYQIFWQFHPPTAESWDIPGPNSERLKPTDPPRSDFTRDNCQDNSCYPGKTCAHNWALTGSCNPGDSEISCPIYFLYNWRWIKSHLWEVGAVTSSIVVHRDLFMYSDGVYSSVNENGESSGDKLGMLDVTIIGWGQKEINLSTSADDYTKSKMRWWYVIPHFGEFTTGSTAFESSDETYNKDTPYSQLWGGDYLFDSKNIKSNVNLAKAVIKFNRRFDDCNIESHAVGAVPFNFIPHPYRTPEETLNEY